jgi:hypothetical protein
MDTTFPVGPWPHRPTLAKHRCAAPCQVPTRSLQRSPQRYRLSNWQTLPPLRSPSLPSVLGAPIILSPQGVQWIIRRQGASSLSCSPLGGGVTGGDARIPRLRRHQETTSTPASATGS